jgi:hypothetical protein
LLGIAESGDMGTITRRLTTCILAEMSHEVGTKAGIAPKLNVWVERSKVRLS